MASRLVTWYRRTFLDPKGNLTLSLLKYSAVGILVASAMVQQMRNRRLETEAMMWKGLFEDEQRRQAKECLGENAGAEVQGLEYTRGSGGKGKDVHVHVHWYWNANQVRGKTRE